MNIKTFSIICIIAVILFVPLFFGIDGIFHDDQAFEEFSRHYFVAQSFQQGEIPRWDPYTWCGAMPFYARYYVDTYYILRLPFYFLANLDNINQTYLMLTIVPLFLHFLIAALGMFFLLRKTIECKIFPSIIGAIIYLYSPVFTSYYIWQQAVALYAWLPWAIILYISCIKEPRLWKMLIVALISSFMVMSGPASHFPFFIFITIFLIALFLAKKKEYSRKTGKIYLISFCIIFIVLLLTAVYTVSCIDGALHTKRYLSLSSKTVLDQQGESLHPVLLSSLIFPNLFGMVDGKYLDFISLQGNFPYWEASFLGGVFIFCLFVIAVFAMFKKNKENSLNKQGIWFWGMFCLFIFSLLCVLGKNFFFYKYFIAVLPGIGQFPNPIRYRFLECFSLAIMLPIGINNLLYIEKNFYLNNIKKIVFGFLLFSLVVLLIALNFPKDIEYQKNYEYPLLKDKHVTATFSLGSVVGAWSPDFFVDCIMIYFDSPSKGKIKIFDNKPKDLEQANDVFGYNVEQKGWHKFNLSIPANKFVWIEQENKIQASVGYADMGTPFKTYIYDSAAEKWEENVYYNSFWFLENGSVDVTLLDIIKKRKEIRKPIVFSIIYFFLAAILIIFMIRFFSYKKFIISLSVLCLCEVIFFGLSAMYKPIYNMYPRARLPLEHSMLKRVQAVNMFFELDKDMRVATTKPYHDNFFRIFSQPTIMGFEMHPLETRFKRAIETAYGKTMDWDIIFNNMKPGSYHFLNNFSAAYLLTTDGAFEFPFIWSSLVPTEENFYLQFNPYALPRVYTVNNIAFSSEEEQLNKLVFSDLRDKVYFSKTEDHDKEKLLKISQNPINFYQLQEKNIVLKKNFENPNKMEVDIDVKIPAVMVMADVYYPGWKVFVDGVESEIYRVNYCQRGVFLDEGRHNVKFYFKPKIWSLSLTISLISLVFVFIFIIKGFLKIIVAKKEG